MADTPKKDIPAASVGPQKDTESTPLAASTKVPLPTHSGVKINVPSGSLSFFSDAFFRVNLPSSIGAPNLYVNLEENLSLLDHPLFSKQHEELLRQMEDLRKQVTEQAKTISAGVAGSEEQRQQIQTLKSTLAELDTKSQLGFLLERVNPEAQKALLESAELRNEFLSQGECRAFVFSVDIRRSTELMLKARSPEQFAQFIITLCSDLMSTIVESFGVFDKFTGDGVLAFFPEFYSGSDAAFRVIAAADRCHEIFERHYYDSRKLFTSVLKDVGVGIGIDYGTVRLVRVAGGLTVVGVPVVYACRLSGAPHGVTLVNQPAYDVISDRFSAFCFLGEKELDIKHEGRMVAYEVHMNGKAYIPASPAWFLSQANKKVG